jgi:hypothetical protein
MHVINTLRQRMLVVCPVHPRDGVREDVGSVGWIPADYVAVLLGKLSEIA